jgi:ESCRT-II complex subunit VPS22
MTTRRTRGVGLSAFQNRSSLTSSYATHGAALRTSHLQSLKTQLSVFQSLLHNFALQHSETIKQNPQFRAEFARMCTTLGVDPLAASNAAGREGPKGKGVGGWVSKVWGKESEEFVAQVALRVVEVCRGTREQNGGLLGVEEGRAMVAKGRGIGGAMEVSR